jgi:hypothetical protein
MLYIFVLVGVTVGSWDWELHLAGATYSRTPRTFETMVVIPYGIGIGIEIGIGIVGSWDWDHGT